MPAIDPDYRYATYLVLSDGVTTDHNIAFDGGYIHQEDVVASSYLLDDTGLITDRTSHPVVFLSEDTDPGTGWQTAQVRVSPAPAAGRFLTIERNTPISASLVDYVSASILTDKNLDLANKQAILALAEVHDKLADLELAVDDRLGDALGLVNDAVDEASAAAAAAEAATTTANAAAATANSAAASANALRTDLASTEAGKGAELVGFKQDGDEAVARAAQDKMREVVSVKDFGAVGDGVADDTSAVQAGIDYVAENGGILRIPRGTYKLTALLGRTTPAPNAFSIQGDGWTATKLVRGADYGSVVSFGNVDNFSVEDLTIVGNFSLYPTNASHGIVWFNGSHVRVSRVKVFDWKNAAIIGYTFPASTNYINNVIDDCFVDGGGAANNGILIADLVKSGIRNCSAVNIGKAGSPCYALQMKNGCQDSFIEGGLATGATIGIACGNYDVSGTNTKNIVRGVKVFNCDAGLAFGTASGFAVSDVVIDMNGAGLSAVDFQGGSVGNSVVNAVIHNMLPGKSAVRFRSGDTDNVVHIASITNASGSASAAAEFNAGSLRNTVVMDRYVNPSTVSDSSTLCVDLSTGSTNVFEYRPLPNKQLTAIASDAVTLRHGRITRLKVDTEVAAATDNLATISGGVDGQTIVVQQTSNTRDVTIKHGTGNIRLNGGVDLVFTGISSSVMLTFDSALAAWIECGRGTAT